MSYLDLEPSSVDIVKSEFTTRRVLIQYKEEIASLNEGCYFRIEIPLEELDKRSCDITFDLYLAEAIHDSNSNQITGFSKTPQVLDASPSHFS